MRYILHALTTVTKRCDMTTQSNNSSPRRRFHRPGESAYTTSHHVPVLTGLPAVGVERFRNRPRRAEQEVPVDIPKETADPVPPSVEPDVVVTDNTDKTAERNYRQHKSHATEVAGEDRVRELLYTVGGTLVAFLLVYVAVSRLSPPATVPAVEVNQPPAGVTTFESVEPVEIPEVTITPAIAPAQTPMQPELAFTPLAEGTTVPAHDWAIAPTIGSVAIEEFEQKAVHSHLAPEVPLVAEAPVRRQSVASQPATAKATLGDTIEPTIATPTPQPVDVRGIQFTEPSPPESASEFDQVNAETEVTDYPTTGVSPLPAIASQQPIRPLTKAMTSLPAPSKAVPSTGSTIRTARLKGSIQPFTTK